MTVLVNTQLHILKRPMTAFSAWSLILSEEHKLRVLRRGLGPKGKEVARG